VLIVWMGISLFWSDTPTYGFRLYIRWLIGFFAYAMVFLTISDRNKRLFFIVYAVVIGSSVCYGLAQRFGFGIALEDTSLFAPQEFLVEAGQWMFRSAGLTGSPNGLGRESALLFCVLLMMLASWRVSPFWKAVIVGMIGINIVVTLLSYSRVGWALVTIGAGTFIIMYRPRWIVPLLVLAVLVAVVAWPQVWARLEPVLSGTDASLESRGHASRIYLEFWRLRPIMGYGLGSTSGGALFQARLWPHEGYVYLLAFFGVIGLMLYIILLLAILKNAYKATRDVFVCADEELRAMAALGFGCAAILALNFVVAIGPYMQTYYLLGASLGALRIARSRYAQQARQAAASGPPASGNARPGTPG